MQARRKSASLGSIFLLLSWVFLAAPGARAHLLRGVSATPDGSADEPQPQSAEAPEPEAGPAASDEADEPQADEQAETGGDEDAADPAPVTDDVLPTESTTAAPAENGGASEPAPTEPAEPKPTLPAPALPVRPAANSSAPEDTTVYKVVLNHEEQYSIWPAARENALGWKDAGFSGSKADCLEYIKRVWTEMRPLSLRKKMEEAAKPPGR